MDTTQTDLYELEENQWLLEKNQLILKIDYNTEVYEKIGMDGYILNALHKEILNKTNSNVPKDLEELLEKISKGYQLKEFNKSSLMEKNGISPMQFLDNLNHSVEFYQNMNILIKKVLSNSRKIVLILKFNKCIELIKGENQANEMWSFLETNYIDVMGQNLYTASFETMCGI